MPITDPIADMLTILKTSVLAHKEATTVKRSKLTENILEILKREGFISNYKPTEDSRQGVIKVYLKYEKNKTPYLTGLKKISKPGRRFYVKHEEIRPVYGGIGVSLISTPKGVMTGKEAKEKNLGGEVLCHVW